MFLFFYIVLGHVVFLPAALRQGRCEFFDDMMFYVFLGYVTVSWGWGVIKVSLLWSLKRREGEKEKRTEKPQKKRTDWCLERETVLSVYL